MWVNTARARGGEPICESIRCQATEAREGRDGEGDRKNWKGEKKESEETKLTLAKTKIMF